jgi:hypothetical protein
MGTDSQLTWGTDTRYEALFGIFEALSTCREQKSYHEFSPASWSS